MTLIGAVIESPTRILVAADTLGTDGNGRFIPNVEKFERLQTFVTDSTPPLGIGWIGIGDVGEAILFDFRQVANGLSDWGMMKAGLQAHARAQNFKEPRAMTASVLLAGFVGGVADIVVCDHTGNFVPRKINENFIFAGQFQSNATDLWTFAEELDYLPGDTAGRLVKVMEHAVDNRYGVGPPIYLWEIDLQAGFRRAQL
jgi:hypothetical protein